ncbi:hypothetical protein [Nocardia jinanensis]|uniref:Uncharacterized protein n=1 Tax=Nocardia jinanensis TaxID=382504 RepID=A0A917RK62_9NOCA|nr:hypothetical protein [Nocardia jinanensis]GGL11777.1 hypothetical protein GCM10011588_27710 [Nocardia jinanensis]
MSADTSVAVTLNENDDTAEAAPTSESHRGVLGWTVLPAAVALFANGWW